MSRKRVIVTGGTGFIGGALVDLLSERGDEVVVLSRGPGSDSWDPADGRLDPKLLEGADAVVNFNGVSIGPSTLLEAPTRRFTSKHRAAILDSRVDSTRLLAETIASLDDKPAVFVSSSAIGYYGDTGDTPVDETGQRGDGFLADVVVAWEAAAEPARSAGVRLALPRTGIVLAREGGALAPLLPLFKAGLAGPLGGGGQWWSWITLEDEVRAIEHLIDGDLDGPVNLTAPNPVTQKHLFDAVGAKLGRPTVVPAPKFALDLVLGKGLAQAIAYGSARVLPARLEESGFDFGSPSIEQAVEQVFG